MPTETFFNLPKEKQARILKAAKQEFSRVGLNEASIARIIKEADISRGSFYQYFTDKEDLYYYYFQTLKSSGHRYLIQTIEEKEGDLFLAIEEYFMRLAPEIFDGEDRQFYQNLFMNLDAHGFQRMVPQLEKKVATKIKPKRCPHQQKHFSVLKVVDTKKLKINNEEELEILFKMLMHVIFSTIAEGYRLRKEEPTTTLEPIIQIFMLKLNWLKDGARRKEETDDQTL